MDDFAVTVGLTGMVDVLRAVSAPASVERPVIINAAYVNASFIFQAARDFAAGNLFASVFGDFAPLFEGDGGETAFAINPGRPDFDAWGLVYFLARLFAGLSHTAFAQSTGNAR